MFHTIDEPHQKPLAVLGVSQRGGVARAQQNCGNICLNRLAYTILSKHGATPLSRSRGGNLLFGGQAQSSQSQFKLFSAQLALCRSESELIIGQKAFRQKHESDGKSRIVRHLDHSPLAKN
jgi:hypothetical protein